MEGNIEHSHPPTSPRAGEVVRSSEPEGATAAARLREALAATTRAHERELVRIWEALCGVRLPGAAAVVTADAIVRKVASLVPQTWTARAPEAPVSAWGDTPESAVRALSNKLGWRPIDPLRVVEARCSDGRRALVLVGNAAPFRVVPLP